MLIALRTEIIFITYVLLFMCQTMFLKLWIAKNAIVLFSTHDFLFSFLATELFIFITYQWKIDSVLYYFICSKL
jgi:hypothetical protein